MIALILAGTRPGTVNRAQTLLCGRPMIDYVITALRGEFGSARSIVVAGLEAGKFESDDVKVVSGGADMVDTLLNSVATLSEDTGRILVSTADIPFLTAPAVRDFVDRASRFPDADFLYSAVIADVCRTAFPDMRRTTLRVAEGEFTGGNLVMISPSFLRRNEATIREAWAQRKSVFGLAKMLGAETMARFLFSRIFPSLLPISYLERAVGKTLGGVSVGLIVSPYPEIAADCDRPEDIVYAERWLQKKAEGKL